jgi:ligand-binding sensor domain-containing protein
LPSGYTFWELQAKNTLKVDPSNNVWIGFQTIGAAKFVGVNWTVYDTTDGLPSKNVLCFAFAGSNTWMGTNKGLVKYNNGSVTVYDSLNSGLTTNYIQSLFIAGNKLWVGTRKGAFKFDGTTWTHYSTLNSGLPNDTVNCFTKSGNDTIWMGTNNGLSKFFNGNWTTYYTGWQKPIRKIVADVPGNIWIDSYQNSLYHNTNILYQDSMSKLTRFFSFCYPVNEGMLLGVHNGNIVLASNNTFELTSIL